MFAEPEPSESIADLHDEGVVDEIPGESLGEVKILSKKEKEKLKKEREKAGIYYRELLDELTSFRRRKKHKQLRRSMLQRPLRQIFKNRRYLLNQYRKKTTERWTKVEKLTRRTRRRRKRRRKMKNRLLPLPQRRRRRAVSVRSRQ